MVKAVRGAIGVREDSEPAIREAAARLLEEILGRNRIRAGRILSVLFTLTGDLTQANPATAVRGQGLEHTPLFCLQEAAVVGAMPRVIRALVLYRGAGRRAPVPVYLDRARALRPDLAGEEEAC